MKTPTNQPLVKRTQIVLFLFCVFSINLNMMAQEPFLEICVTPENTEEDPPEVHSYSKSAELLNSMEPVVINIFIGKSMTRMALPEIRHSVNKEF